MIAIGLGTDTSESRKPDEGDSDASRFSGRFTTVVAMRSTHSNHGESGARISKPTKGIAVDLAGRGITVNNIQPGPTVTDMTVHLIEAIKPLIPLKRAADPDEIAGLVAYLASKESGYMTGSSLTIDGGMAL